MVDITSESVQNHGASRHKSAKLLHLSVQYVDAGAALSAFLLFYCSVHLHRHPLLVDFMPRRSPDDWSIPPEYIHDVQVRDFHLLFVARIVPFERVLTVQAVICEPAHLARSSPFATKDHITFRIAPLSR